MENILDKKETAKQIAELCTRFDDGKLQTDDYIKIRLYYKRIFEGTKEFDSASYSGIEGCNKCTRLCVNQLRSWGEKQK